MWYLVFVALLFSIVPTFCQIRVPLHKISPAVTGPLEVYDGEAATHTNVSLANFMNAQVFLTIFLQW